jgi:hypothetical protein
MSKVQQRAAGSALKISSFSRFKSVIERRDDVRSSLLVARKVVQSATTQCNAFSVHWCSVQCTLPLKGERVLLHLSAASPDDSASPGCLRNLLLDELSCLACVSHVKSEPGRKSVNAPHRRRGCGIGARGAVSKESGCRNNSTKRTRRAFLGSDRLQFPTWRS